MGHVFSFVRRASQVIYDTFLSSKLLKLCAEKESYCCAIWKKMSLVTYSVGLCLDITDVLAKFLLLNLLQCFHQSNHNQSHNWFLLIRVWLKDRNPSLEEIFFQLIFLSNFEAEMFDQTYHQQYFMLFCNWIETLLSPE